MRLCEALRAMFPWRLIRNPARRVARYLTTGEALTPANLTYVAIGAAILWMLPLAANGGLEALSARATALAGIRIDNVDVTGGKEVSKIDVLSTLDLGPERSLLTFDLNEAREELRNLPWASDVTIAKVYPDTVKVRLVEKVPFAVWQQGEELWLITRDGRQIVAFDDRFAGLPLVVGTGAEKNAAQILSLVERHPDLRRQSTAFVRVGDRRWNIMLDGGLVLMLPETGVEDALIRFMAMHADIDLAALDISHVDMRLRHRTVLKLTESGKASFDEFLKSRTARVKTGTDS